MNETLKSLLARLQNLEDNYQIRDPGVTEFRSIKTELQGLIDLPEPAPKTIVQTQVVTEELTGSICAHLDSRFSGVMERLANVERAAAVNLDQGKAVADKIDGMEDTLAAWIADQPAQESTVDAAVKL